MNALFEKIDNLSLEKSRDCNLERFVRAFLERSELIEKQLLPSLKKEFDCIKFQSKVMLLHSRKWKIELKSLQDTIIAKGKIPNTIKFYKPMFDIALEQLKIKKFEDLILLAKQDLSSYDYLDLYSTEYKNIHGNEDNHYIAENYIYFFIGRILYDNYRNLKSKKEKYITDYSATVYEEYSKIDIDLKSIDNQFAKYKLLSLNDDIDILNDKDSQTISDRRIQKFFWITIPRKLLTTIELLIKKEIIEKIAFQVDYISESVPSMEEMEYGSPLEFNLSELPKLSSFYSSKNYENKLWVKHDVNKRSLTFEETLEDFDTVGDDAIATQVIHLEYFKLEDSYYINHLDHEYIIYDWDEYDKRLINSEIKGHKKIKTFKIDEAKIPFYFKSNGEYFLYQVLDSYLKNKELISEYFERLE